jgi:hypothetical protein
MPINALGHDESAIAGALASWWKAELAEQANDPFAKPKPPAGSIFDVVPEIDSHSAVRALLEIEEHVPFEVPVCVIKRGGYSNLFEMCSDLLPKIRALALEHESKVNPISSTPAISIDRLNAGAAVS